MEKPEVKGGEATSGKSCKSCKVVKSAAGFSKKQFKAPENVRKCLVCMGLSVETGVPGLRIGDSVRLHSLKAAEYNGLAGKIVAALNGQTSACTFPLLHSCLLRVGAHPDTCAHRAQREEE